MSQVSRSALRTIQVQFCHPHSSSAFLGKKRELQVDNVHSLRQRNKPSCSDLISANAAPAFLPCSEQRASQARASSALASSCACSRLLSASASAACVPDCRCQVCLALSLCIYHPWPSQDM